MPNRLGAGIASVAGALGAAASLFAGAAAVAQITEQKLVSANAYTSPARTQRLLARLEFSDAFRDLDAARKRAAPQIARDLRKSESGARRALSAKYGDALLFTDPAAAIPFLEEAVSGDAPSEAETSLALAQFALTPADTRVERALLATLEARDRAGVPDTEISARAWFALALKAAREARLYEARPLAERAERALAAALPENAEALANVAMLRGVATLFFDDVPTVEALGEAEGHFLRAAKYFPPQADVESFHPVAAAAATWMFAAQTIRVRLGRTVPNQSEADQARLWRTRNPTWGECGFEWQKVPPGQYPREARMKGDIGFVLVGYDLNGKLKPINVRILGEAPNPYFGKIALAAAKNARVRQRNPSRSLDPACLRNRVSGWRFDVGSKPFKTPKTK